MNNPFSWLQLRKYLEQGNHRFLLLGHHPPLARYAMDLFREKWPGLTLKRCHGKEDYEQLLLTYATKSLFGKPGPLLFHLVGQDKFRVASLIDPLRELLASLSEKSVLLVEEALPANKALLAQLKPDQWKEWSLGLLSPLTASFWQSWVTTECSARAIPENQRPIFFKRLQQSHYQCDQLSWQLADEESQFSPTNRLGEAELVQLLCQGLFTKSLASGQRQRDTQLFAESPLPLLLIVRLLQNQAIKTKPVSAHSAPGRSWFYLLQLLQQTEIALKHHQMGETFEERRNFFLKFWYFWDRIRAKGVQSG